MSPSPTRIWIGITDNDWFRFLRDEPDLDEVNFWQPSGNRAFRALQPGDLFLFKLHSPHDYIVGGGFFVRYVSFPYLWVWETFGPKNGAASLAEMKRRIEKYRRHPVGPADPIGCIILGQPFFWDRPDWIPAPADFAKNIVQGKTYAADSATARDLWKEVELRLQATAPMMLAEAAEPVPMWSEPTLVRLRLGQGTFRALTTDNYQRRCAVTGEKALPVLDASHIRPVGAGSQHRLDNGLLLRTDIHREPAAQRRLRQRRAVYAVPWPEDLDTWRPNGSAGPASFGWHAEEVFLR